MKQKRSKRTGHSMLKLVGGTSTIKQPLITARTKQEKAVDKVQDAIDTGALAIIVNHKMGKEVNSRTIHGQNDFHKLLYDLKYHYDAYLFSEHLDSVSIDSVNVLTDINEKSLLKLLS